MECVNNELYVFILASLETLAEEVESPYGNDKNDLPLDAIKILIEKDICDIFINYPVPQA